MGSSVMIGNRKQTYKQTYRQTPNPTLKKYKNINA